LGVKLADAGAYTLWWDTVDFDDPVAMARARRVAELLVEFKGETPDPWASPDSLGFIKVDLLNNKSIITTDSHY
jgi:hypothetical protein